ncbi:HNH endonuclease signature motif containing protein [Corynebacterium ammoniagenes]|uniref:HNH nuclease domain-containing protein n=1 Tax=Corynebacterium ammoniagenes TaxID=1697 RepID=A0AAV5GBL1_CORAM|nr:HNH endonuclease signature motif containing protein [Corynebacterium ammoniagenes]GJN43660.1 hypothetical protein CAT723_21390 [Corynebacterium ammoniagenes]
MDIFQAFVLLNSHGIGLLRAIAERSPYDVASSGIALSTAKQYATLADVLFGPADSPRLQRESVALAEQRELSVEHLLMVNKHAKKLKKRGAAWKLRAELIAHQGSFEEADAYGAQRVKEEIGETPKQPGVRIGRAVNGMRTLTVTDTQRRITDFEKTLDATDTTDQPRSTALLDAFWKRVEGGGGVLRPEYRTVIAIGLDDFAKVSCGNGDEVIVGLSDGTTMTGAELINAALSGALGENLYAGLFHPTAGPVNLYEARFASLKQRIVATAENLVCPWPDCNVPADRCQVHHIDAHKNGGHTSPSNLTMLCRYHNGVNDDDPTKRRRGRIQRHRGQVRLITPGGKLLGNTHHLSNMGAMDLIK